MKTIKTDSAVKKIEGKIEEYLNTNKKLIELEDRSRRNKICIDRIVNEN